jgi:hypothetical protein
MGIIKAWSRLGALLASLGVIVVAFTSAAQASTTVIPRPGGPGGLSDTAGGSGTAGVVVVRTVVGGMPGWQIALIAIIAALVAGLAAAVAAVLVDRTRSARRRLASTPA